MLKPKNSKTIIKEITKPLIPPAMLERVASKEYASVLYFPDLSARSALPAEAKEASENPKRRVKVKMRLGSSNKAKIAIDMLANMLPIAMKILLPNLYAKIPKITLKNVSPMRSIVKTVPTMISLKPCILVKK